MKRKSSCLGALVVGCLVVVVLSAIVGNLPGGAPAAPAASNESKFAPAAAGPTATAEPTAEPRGYVSRAVWGDNWPLTVDDGVLKCYPDLGQAVTITTGGVEYGVNGPARSSKAPATWRDGQSIMTPEVVANSVSDKRLFALIDAGLKFCESQ